MDSDEQRKMRKKEYNKAYKERNHAAISLKQKEYRKKNTDTIKRKEKDRYLKDKEGRAISNKQYYENNKLRLVRSARDKRERQKLICLSHYSGGNVPVCSHKFCNIMDVDMLTIDHIDDNGRKHRSTLSGNGTGEIIYRWLIKNGFPSGYQVLCWNHNVKKEYERRRKS